MMPAAKASDVVLAIEGTCLCKAVRVGAVRVPAQVTQCNCSVCRRYGTLWAYYKRTEVVVEAARGILVTWRAKRGGLRFLRCKGCGCVACWDAPSRGSDRRLGMNTRLFDHVAMADVPIAVLDGDKSWRVTDKYVKPDIWVSPKRSPRSTHATFAKAGTIATSRRKRR